VCEYCIKANDEELAKLFHDAYAAATAEQQVAWMRESSIRRRRRRRRGGGKNGRSSVRRNEARKQRITELYDVFGRTCHYCGGIATTRDHIIPTSRGGPKHNLLNQVLSCEPCNQDKADSLPTCECARCARALEMFWNGPIDYWPDNQFGRDLD
jgi:5-methylcytosine-specific restriction endonuclease McrA